MNNKRLIETDHFDFEFLSGLAEQESWRKEIHRPIYHLHKWWAKRLGSVFRGILLGGVLPETDKLQDGFYSILDFSKIKVFDPFIGSGTTVGEAHKLGMTSLGRDINPVAVEAVRVALGAMDKRAINKELERLKNGVGEKILAQYRSLDSKGMPCDVLYYFWVMQINCPLCNDPVDLFRSWVISKNAYPDRKQEIQVLCPNCGEIFPSVKDKKEVICRSCQHEFVPADGNANGAHGRCQSCGSKFPILSAIKNDNQPKFRLYGKLILTMEGRKEYLATKESDSLAYRKASEMLEREILNKKIALPDMSLDDGYNTKQAISYGFKSWRQFFNDRQLLCLGWLNQAIAEIPDQKTRDLFLVIFSGVLEFNNMFASYKGEGTGAVRHMFSHHILKPERTPIEANVWGTMKSSGSFSGLFKNRFGRAFAYRQAPTEVALGGKRTLSSKPFSGLVEPDWPKEKISGNRAIYLSCGDSANTKLPPKSIDLVVTDPPFFDNVNYSELADFFFSWQRLVKRGFIDGKATTRAQNEVQDQDPTNFANKLESVFEECNRILRDDGLLIFTYHHSRDEGWRSLAHAILGAGFSIINAHPVKSEMSVAVPKAQANEPIQLDMIIVCRKNLESFRKPSIDRALIIAQSKVDRLESAGFSLSRNDKRIIVFGQLLTCLKVEEDIDLLPAHINRNETGIMQLPLNYQ